MAKAPKKPQTIAAIIEPPVELPKELRPVRAGETAREYLDDAQRREAFWRLVTLKRGVKPACEAVGLAPASVFTLAHRDPSGFGEEMRGAQKINLEAMMDECSAIADKATRDTWKVDHLRIETRMRLAGKLIPAIYGDRPASIEVNANVNAAIVCGEAERAKLIALREHVVAKEAQLQNGNSTPARTGQITNALPSSNHFDAPAG